MNKINISQFKKVIIWGHPLHSHTMSYVNNGFYRAFQYLGFDTYWFHNGDCPDENSLDYSNSLFFTEGFADDKIPIRKDCTYLVHGAKDPAKYIGKCKQFTDLRYYHKVMSDGLYDYVMDKTKLEKLGPLCYFEKAGAGTERVKSNYVDYECQSYQKVYCAWAALSLPHEFNENDVNFPRENVIHYCGTIANDNSRCENGSVFRPFIESCHKAGIPFIHNNPWHNPLSDEEVKLRAQKSLFNVDLRGPELNYKNGYIPCRSFKGLSWGTLSTTNSKNVYEELEGHILYEPDPAKTLELGLSRKDDKEFILKGMRYCKEYHTYINRIESLLKVLN